ncbi:MAG: DUF1788 domain-containing protein [Deltaproteobacteria bacterium]|nr:DUF1788 domain-containing protein [Deltaproteobacteria bacterium]
MASSQQHLEDHRRRLKLLEADLCAREMRISAYHDLPFAIYRYDPTLEYEIRREADLLATRIKNQTGKEVVSISLAELLFQAVENTVGWESVIQAEREFGFHKAQETVHQILSDPNYADLPRMLEERLKPLDPARNIVFLMRAAAMAPALYHMSKLLEQMQGRTDVPTIFFYPGALVGVTGLDFMAMGSRDVQGSYRVKIY